jgi:hypothetical protein
MSGAILRVAREVREKPTIIIKTGLGDAERLRAGVRDLLGAIPNENKAGKSYKHSEKYSAEYYDEQHN